MEQPWVRWNKLGESSAIKPSDSTGTAMGQMEYTGQVQFNHIFDSHGTAMGQMEYMGQVQFNQTFWLHWNSHGSDGIHRASLV